MKIYMVSLLHRATINYIFVENQWLVCLFSSILFIHSSRHYHDNFLLQQRGNVQIARQQPLQFTGCTDRFYMLSPIRLSSVCLLSVTFVCPTQAVHIFRNFSTALGTLAIHWHPLKILRRLSHGKPSAGGVKHKRGSKKDFGPIDGYVSETVQDRR